MGRLHFRTRRVVATSLLVIPGLALAYACGSPSTAPPAGGGGGFGDGGLPGMKDVKVVPPKKDAAPLDAKKAKDGAKDAPVDATGDEDAPTGTACTAPDQCSSLVCAPGAVVVNDAGRAHDAGSCTAHTCTCQAPSCTDGVKNGLETGVDCGGNCPEKCVDNVGCLIGSDCVSGVCGGVANQDGGAGAVCQAPSCTDGVQNGTETDVDCGSSGFCPAGETCQTCPGCTTGEACTKGSDCTSAICSDMTCSCPDGMAEVVASPPYCIDTYEVTIAQYTTFLDLGVGTGSLLPLECQWKSSFEPEGLTVPSMADQDNPITNVDWCDALTYCANTGGKHLCGTIATPRTSTMPAQAGGLPVTFPGEGGVLAVNDYNVDEWYNACSAQGSLAYFYKDSYERGFCNGIDAPSQQASGLVDSPPGPGNTYISLGDAGPPICIFDQVCNNPADQYRTVRAAQTVECHAGTPYACDKLTSCGNFCGPVSDGCGGLLQCPNTCAMGKACGAGGTPSVCGAIDAGGCVAATVEAACGNFDCGQLVSDGCGGTVQCPGSPCTPPATCGGGGASKPNMCGFSIPSPGCTAAFDEDSCHNIAASLFDMSGNVAEWENSCDGNTGAADLCLVRGGSFDSPNGQASMSCGWTAAQPPLQRNTTAADIGFRCCL